MDELTPEEWQTIYESLNETIHHEQTVLIVIQNMEGSFVQKSLEHHQSRELPSPLKGAGLRISSSAD